MTNVQSSILNQVWQASGKLSRPTFAAIREAFIHLKNGRTQEAWVSASTDSGALDIWLRAVSQEGI